MVEQPQQCQAALQALLAQRVDALLVNVPLDDPHAEQLRALASPVPVLFSMSPSAQVNSLVFNAEQGRIWALSICFRWGISALPC
jgi:DNA-binding LacI/PurR family transcriptional regulator